MRDVLDLAVRWVHVIAGILWIGNSMLWNWIDRNLEDRKIWLLHSGAFYHMEKTLEPEGGLPDPLHWFKWQSYTTWMSGAALLVIVYYFGGGAMLLAQDSALKPMAAIGISAALILLAWPVYNLLRFNAITGILALLALSYGLTQIFNGRAAFLHVGAMMATIMAGNVFRVIMPSQRELVAKVKAGEPGVPVLAARAKARSIHNNYLTFPVIALMVSGHFPSLYQHHWNWVLLAVIVVAGALVRHFMNIRFGWPHWETAIAGTVVVAMAILVYAVLTPKAAPVAAKTVTFADARSVIDRRCAACHSSHPFDDGFKSAPAGVKFDTPEMIAAMAPRIYQRAVVDKTMPFQNRTKITDEERAVLGAWVKAGAKIR